MHHTTNKRNNHRFKSCEEIGRQLEYATQYATQYATHLLFACVGAVFNSTVVMIPPIRSIAVGKLAGFDATLACMLGDLLKFSSNTNDDDDGGGGVGNGSVTRITIVRPR